MSQFLPYGRQHIDDDDIAAVVDVLKSDALTTGPVVPAFEAALTERLGAADAVSCSSGTAGLHLAMLALGVSAGDWVIVPAVTFLATANAVRLAGGEVIFADVDPATGLMTPEALEAILAKFPDRRIKGVIPVHMAGEPADMRMITGIARHHGLFVVEDACHALGASCETDAAEWAAVGSCALSDATVFSFHPVKAIATGEGGAVTVRDADFARRLRLLRNHGMERQADDPEPWRYRMRELGLNYRLTDIQAALGLSQLKKLDKFVAARARLAARYDRLLAPLAPLVRPCPVANPERSAWHLYRVLMDFSALGLSRGAVMRALAKEGIGTQVHYTPVSSQPYYERRYGAAELPGAAAYYRQVLSLPLYPGLGDAGVDEVVAALSDITSQVRQAS